MKEENNNLNVQNNNSPVVNISEEEKPSVVNIEEVDIKEVQKIIDNMTPVQSTNTSSPQGVVIEDKKNDNIVTTNTTQIKDDVISSMNNTSSVSVQPQSPIKPANSQISDFDDVRETKKKSPLIIILVVLILLVVGVFGFYFFYLTPNKIFNKTIDKLSGYSAKGLDDLTELVNKEYKTITSNMSLDYNIKAEDQTLTNNINAKSGFDKEQKILYTQIDGKNTESNQYTLSMLLDKTNKLYLSTDKKFDKGIYYDLSSNELMFSLDSISFDKLGSTMSSLTYIVNKSFDAFKDSYDTSRLKKSIELKTINGKKVLTTKLSDSISEKDAAIIGNKMIDIFAADDKFLESTINLFGTLMSESLLGSLEKDDVKSMLEESKSDVETADDSDKTNFALNYSMNGELVYAQISKDDENVYLEHSDGIYTITQKDTSYDDDENIVKYIYDSSKETLTVKYEEGEFTLSCKSDKVSDKEYKYDMTMNLTSEDTKFDFNLTSTIKFDGNLEKFDVSKCKDSGSLTEDEMSEFQGAFLNIMPISLTPVLQNMDNATTSAFTTKIKAIVASAQNKFEEEKINGNANSSVTYSNISTCKSNGVAIDEKYLNDVSYSITFDKNGKIISFNASNGTHSYSVTNIEDSTDIDSDDIVTGSSYNEAKCTK